ncbi:MAG TPA: hypothetical protein VNA32_02140 [Actinomycetota bacterium]|nr:hypothetical protein [Actinomycetota bacterium]
MAAVAYRRKPSRIKAIQWTGDNLDELRMFAGDAILESGVGIAVRSANGPVPIEEGSWVATRLPIGAADFYPIVDSEFWTLYEVDI